MLYWRLNLCFPCVLAREGEKDNLFVLQRMHLWITENTSYAIHMKRSGTPVDILRKGIVLFSRKGGCDYTFGTSVWEVKWRLFWEEAWREGAWGSGFIRWWKLSSVLSWILGLAFGRRSRWGWRQRECCEDGHPATWHHVLDFSLLPAWAVLPGFSQVSLQTVIPTNPVRECSLRAYTLERGWKRPQGKYMWVWKASHLPYISLHCEAGFSDNDGNYSFEKKIKWTFLGAFDLRKCHLFGMDFVWSCLVGNGAQGMCEGV